VNVFVDGAKYGHLALSQARELLSESLVVTTILRGLPPAFNTIVVVQEAEEVALPVDGVQPKLQGMEQSLGYSQAILVILAPAGAFSIAVRWYPHPAIHFKSTKEVTKAIATDISSSIGPYIARFLLN
jgi:hypothetical protein